MLGNISGPEVTNMNAHSLRMNIFQAIYQNGWLSQKAGRQLKNAPWGPASTGRFYWELGWIHASENKTQQQIFPRVDK